MENSQRIGYLIGGFITQTLTIEEREELDAWVVADEANMQIFEDMTDEKMVDTFLKWLATRDTEGKLIDMKKRLRFKEGGRVIKWWQYAAAACLVGIVGFAIYYLVPQQDHTPLISKQERPDILPGSAYAELKLPSGKVIKLDGLADTVIDEAITIKNGVVAYSDIETDPLTYEINIPRKGSYQLVLSDGTKVWLNAESSIRYPGAFNGNTREVTVTGETYFEVAKNKSKPFIVSTGNVKVQAVGTAFNINGFDSTITLTEGIVKIDDSQHSALLKPGQQLGVKDWAVKSVDTDPVIAWTRNEFKFKHAAIEEIMRPIERWYNARVVYKDKISFHFNATIERSVPVSKVLALLEETGNVKFAISGDTITVSNDGVSQ